MNETTPFLSIIVPAYNIEAYIRMCVESILQQTYRKFELILVDDGSTDRTGTICEEYAEADDRVRVIHKKNGGLVSARKAGIRCAAGEYVTYVDGDDWIRKDTFFKMCRKAEETNADIVIADLVSVGREQKKLIQNMEAGYYNKEKLEKDFYPMMLSKGEYFSFGMQPSLCGRLFRREILLPIQLQVNESIRLGEDAACCYDCFLAAKSLYYMKGECLYCYRMRESSISHAIIKTYYTQEIISLAMQMEEEFHKYPEQIDELENQLCYYIIYMIENMFTPNLSLWHVLFSRKFRDEVKLLGDSEIGKEVCQFAKMHNMSSKMKRIVNIIENNTIAKRGNLLLFYGYEILKSKFCIDFSFLSKHN